MVLLESTNGDLDNLDMLLAHEFTHFVRRQIFKRDIFENSIGERFVVENHKGFKVATDLVTHAFSKWKRKVLGFWGFLG